MKEKQKKKPSQNKPHGNFLIGWICSTVITIIAVNVYGNYHIFKLLSNNDCPQIISTAIESSLLSSGLALIGLSISVWAALNIMNALDKKDFDVLQDSVKKLQDEQNAHLDLLKIQYANLQKQQQQSNENQFFSELIKSIDDTATKHLIQNFSRFVRDSEVCFTELITVEQHFSNTYQLYRKSNSRLLTEAAEKGIQITESLLKKYKGQDNITSQFLTYRLGEFHFYRAYGAHVPALDVKKHFEKAIDSYKKCEALLDICLPTYDPGIDYDHIAQNVSVLPNSVLSYQCNTIGEAYSKIVERAEALHRSGIPADFLNDYGRRAIFYCKYAVVLSNFQNQIYLRNLGCALERTYGSKRCADKNAAEIRDVYQYAMDCSLQNKNVPMKVFHTWLSFDHKYADYIHSGKSNSESPDTLIERNRRALVYAKMAVATYPDNLMFLKLYALTLRDACIWQTQYKKNSADIQQYKEAFSRCATELKLLYAGKEYDPYMKDILKAEEELFGKQLSAKSEKLVV